MTQVIPRVEVFDAYWNFVIERQKIFYRRLHGYPEPWTEDKILGNHRFCNVYRASDRVSQYLIKHVIYGKHLSREPEDIVFRILLFRFFNLESTWDLLEKLYGDPRISNFDVETWYKGMETGSQGRGLFNGAYMLCGIKTHGYDRKHGNYLGLVNDMVQGGTIQKILGAGSMGEIYRELNKYPLVGKFLSYQIATDLNYSDVVTMDDDSFTMAGPGAERGIQKVFSDAGGKSPEYLIQWMRENQEAELTKRGYPLELAWLWGKPLQNIDIQNCFCETDKYCREKFPGLGGEGSPKKIKQGFKSASKPRTENLFYPPKWGINGKLKKLPPVEKLLGNIPEEEELPWFMGPSS